MINYTTNILMYAYLHTFMIISSEYIFKTWNYVRGHTHENFWYLCPNCSLEKFSVTSIWSYINSYQEGGHIFLQLHQQRAAILIIVKMSVL